MKVAMFGPFYEEPVPGGVEQHVYHLSNALEKHGVEVERWSWKIPRDINGIRKFSLFDMKKALWGSEADLVHLHSTAIAFSSFSGLAKFTRKTVATIHAFHQPETESSLRLKMMGHVLSSPYISALRKIRNNIAVSEYARKEADAKGVPVKAVIGSGIDFEAFQNIAWSPELESDVILVARLNAQKGVFDFIEAFSNSSIKAMIVGYGEPAMEKKVKELCEKGGIKLFLHASREETLSAIKSSKILAMPSKGETFGIVGLEAMALGKPVIVYDEAGGPLDYVRNGVNGLVVESSPGALRKWSSSLLGNEGLCKTLSKNALKTAQENGWGRVAGKVENFYELTLRK